MNGGNRLEDLIRGGHQQSVESETTEHANNAAESSTTHTPKDNTETDLNDSAKKRGGFTKRNWRWSFCWNFDLYVDFNNDYCSGGENFKAET